MRRRYRRQGAERTSKLEASWLFSRTRRQRARVERRKVAVIQGESSEGRDQNQRRDRGPGEEMERVDEGERVGLQANVGGDESGRAAGGRRGPIRSGRQPGRHQPHGVVSDPVARLDVEPQEIRMQFLLLRDEAAHHRRPDLSAENTYEVEERGERQHTERRLETAGEEGL